VIKYIDAHAEEQQLDFLSKPFGLEADDTIWEMSYPATLTSQDGREATIRIMHPLHCFMSRVANVGGLQKYQTEHGVKQMKASILCMQASLKTQLDEGEVKTVTKLSERIFEFSRTSEHAHKVFLLYDIEPFDAVFADDERLPEMFRKRRYPQMLEQIRRKRGS
jgi:hypothetical protein